MRSFERRRIWLALVGICLGVVIGRARFHPVGAAALVLAPVLLLAARRPRAPAVVGLFLLGVAAGLLDSGIRARVTPLERLAPRVPVCDLAGRIVEHQGGLGTYLAVERARCGDATYEGSLGNAVVEGVVGAAGGRFHGSARLVPLTRSSFDAARREQGASASLRSANLRTTAPRSPARYVAARIRGGLADATSALEPRRAALLRGLTIGDTEGMDGETTQRFRRSGLSHLVAVSGSNVAIVVGAVAWLLTPAGSRIRSAGAAAALALFVLVVGPEPSVLRAGAMGAIAIAALASGRTAEPLNTLGLALVAVVLWRPGLVSSPGLHLSAAATAGLVLWSGPLAARLTVLPRPLALGVAATVAAQVAVAPILILAFGQLSVVAPLANVLAVPAVPAATILGLVAGIVQPVSSEIARLLARAAEPFSWWILAVGDTTGGSPWAALELPRSSGWLAAVPVTALAWGTLRAPRRAQAKFR